MNKHNQRDKEIFDFVFTIKAKIIHNLTDLNLTCFHVTEKFISEMKQAFIKTNNKKYNKIM